MFVNSQIILASSTLRNISFLPRLKTSDASYFDFLEMSGDFFPLPGSPQSFCRDLAPSSPANLSCSRLTLLWAGTSRALFLLFTCLSLGQPWSGQEEGLLLLNSHPPGSRRGITDTLLQRCHLLCEEERGQVKRKGEGKGGYRQRVRGVFRPTVPPLVPRFPGRGQPAEPTSDH